MPTIGRRILDARRLRLALAAALCLAPLAPAVWGAGIAAQPAQAAPTLPARISDSAFWRMVTEFSEPGGFFRSDNFVSNEVTFQHVIPTLVEGRAQRGVYMGVGPDQNFTYLVALQPKMAFIVDIRRQNMLQHLLYKSLMERSPDRAEFLSKLFSRKRPAGLAAGATAAELFLAYAEVPGDSALFARNLGAAKQHLVKQKGFALSEEDLRSIESVYTAFFTAGPDLTYSYSVGSGAQWQLMRRRMPTYGELMVETDALGEPRSYLATEANYRILRGLQQNNLIVPVVGDFGGEKAIRAVGKYLRERNATVTAFYTSNVEQYLFQQEEAWRGFFGNVATLPLDSASTFVRAIFNTFVSYPPTMNGTPGPRSVTLLSPILEVLKAFEEGKVQTYYDVIQMSK
jgi:hypothetical protein